jgi:hypothetical protein
MERNSFRLRLAFGPIVRGTEYLENRRVDRLALSMVVLVSRGDVVGRLDAIGSQCAQCHLSRLRRFEVNLEYPMLGLIEPAV